MMKRNGILTTGKKLNKIILTLGLLSTGLFASEALYKSCAGCHGINGEKKALGKSEVISGWSKEKVELALKGYKDGSYGKAMKGVMKGQVVRLSDADIDSLGAYISGLKK